LATIGLLFLIALLVSWTLSPAIRRAAFALGAVDLPGERKIHTVPTPRIGGVIIAFSVGATVLSAVGLARLFPSAIAIDLTAWWPVLGGGAIVFLGGALDDIKPLPVWGKFLVQAAGALVAIGLGVRIEHVTVFGSDMIELGLFAVPLTLLWIVGITNAFNLVDGLDGLAVGLGSIAAGTCAVLFMLRGETQEAIMLIVVLGAMLGFLPHNFNPARIYLGDSGSLLTGYVLAVTAIVGTQKTATAMAVFIPLLVLGLPIADTLFSMFRRFVGVPPTHEYVARHQKSWPRALKRMFEADQEHFHHRLLAIGFSHRNAVLTLYAVAVTLSFLAVLSVLAEYRNAGIMLMAVGLAAVIGIGKLDYRDVQIVRIGALLRWYENLAFDRRFFVGFVDLMVITTAYVGAFVLKFTDDRLTNGLQTWYANSFPTVLIAQFLCFCLFGLYRGVWRAMDLGDVLKIAFAVSTAVIVSASLLFLGNPPVGTMSFFAVDLLLLGLFAGGVRSFYRILDYVRQRGIGQGGSALIYGAGHNGQMVLRELRHNATLGFRPIGFIDDDTKIRHRTINRTPVLGTSQDVPGILAREQVNVLIVSSTAIEESQLMEVVQSCKDRGIIVLQADFQFRPLEMEDESSAERIASPYVLGMKQL
jgi:UDP-GlcNAc:undecaprenyl-phosphate/decaprenyl-phosphate GlcNAc-1-phosphate transferase